MRITTRTFAHGAACALGSILTTATNHLIELLPAAERRRFLSRCERVELARGEVLGERGNQTQSVYFPTEGFISSAARLEGDRLVEVGMVGREGMWGSHVVLQVATDPLYAVVLAQGAAWRMSARAFRQEFARNAALQRSIGRYIFILMAQLATAAPCLRFHRIRPRLARWLLMSQDRARSDSFFATQARLSDLLGVRRVGVTDAAGDLQRRGLIEYSRGDITVLNRAGLEGASCSCYATDREVYSRLLS